MKLYRFEARVNKEKNVHIVVAAEDEATAFNVAEVELEKSYLQTPIIEELSLYDTRIITKHAGFVIGHE
ncbi:hypothetical protein CR194_19060 [Salipaludibacillus keqinensis]|uniref:DUF3906 domain-containing protein n=1 Tax=Salipaludibacillus keqinensis TaxID=2045207 RepID=A0A323T5K9_9BACI|nr:DUF3906 family protein [Salipaludibacillus keqinensis]PYZ91722.1 hypothetical protein CR194_19060 [Salipaludibacillus keqinensis]